MECEIENMYSFDKTNVLQHEFDANIINKHTSNDKKKKSTYLYIYISMTKSKNNKT